MFKKNAVRAMNISGGQINSGFGNGFLERFYNSDFELEK